MILYAKIKKDRKQDINFDEPHDNCLVSLTNVVHTLHIGSYFFMHLKKSHEFHKMNKPT